MFEVLSGRSLCRHEENTVARQGVEIAIGGKGIDRRENLNPMEPAVFVVRLRHTGYDQVHPWYNVRLVRSAMKGFTGAITLAGHPLTNFIEFTNLEKDQWVEVELVVHRSYTSYFFEDHTLEMCSQCEDQFSRNQMPVEIIHDTVSFSTTWLQACAEGEIMPNVDVVSIKSSSISPFPVEIQNPSHQLNKWYDINDLELRLVWKVWTPDDSASSQYAKIDGDDILKSQTDLMKERSSATYIDWDMSGLNDGKYTIQVEMKCFNRPPEYTDPKTVYIQQEELQVAGYTQPPDGGIFSFDTDIVVQFNRELNYFNPNISIDVKLLENSLVNVPMHMFCKGNTLVATPTVAVDLDRIDGKQLRITIVQVIDFAGNFLNSEDGVSTYNGISWIVRAHESDNFSTLPSRLSMCIDEKAVVDASEQQLHASKTSLKKSIHETFGYLRSIHMC